MAQRRLAAIMFTDMVGYTALGQRNESLSLALLEEQRKLVRPILGRHNGREVKTMGDAFLVEFPSALDAVTCAYDIQRSAREYNISLPKEGRIHLRVGVHLGDVVESQGDISGDAVNVASRIEPLADDGGVCLTRQVYDGVVNKTEIRMDSIGVKALKNVTAPVEVYRMVMPWEGERPTPSVRPDNRRLAVLPFVNMSADPNDMYFADGITEEIISTVSGISGLEVISRTSVMGYRGTTKKVGEIGRELEVGSVLEGSLRKAGNKVRITTQLIEVAGDRHLWVESYDRELDDVFAIQSDVAKQVATALRVKILPHEESRITKVPTESPEAHDLYLKGRYLWNQRSRVSMLDAIETYKAAIGLDPSYALPYSGIADCYTVLGDHGIIPSAAAFSNAYEYAAKAVELDGSSAEAHTSLAYNVQVHKRDPLGAEREFKKALELSPSYATAHHWYAVFLSKMGRTAEALEEAQKAQQLDPLSPQIASFVGLVQCYIGLYELAERQQFRALELQPGFLPGIANLGWIYLHEHKYDEALKQEDEAFKIDGDELAHRFRRAARLSLAGREAEARKAMAEAQSLPNPDSMHQEDLILYFIGLRELEPAVDLVQLELESRADWLGEIAFDPIYAPLKADPRVISILRRLGISV